MWCKAGTPEHKLWQTRAGAAWDDGSYSLTWMDTAPSLIPSTTIKYLGKAVLGERTAVLSVSGCDKALIIPHGYKTREHSVAPCHSFLPLNESQSLRRLTVLSSWGKKHLLKPTQPCHLMSLCKWNLNTVMSIAFRIDVYYQCWHVFAHHHVFPFPTINAKIKVISNCLQKEPFSNY